jgi:chitosanase
MSDEAGRLSKEQIATIDAIVSLFETRSPANYAAIANDARDAGGLSYGKHQAALTKGKLFELIDSYCSAPNAKYADRLRPYLPRMQAGDRVLDNDNALIALLREAATDDVMQQVQDEYFEAHFMGPALREAAACGFQTPLAHAVVYDSFIHGSWESGANIKGRTTTRVGPPSAQNEREWIAAYLQERRAWLAGHSNTLLRNTVYRMDCFIPLVNEGKWDLALPLTLHLNGYTFTLTPWDFAAHGYDDPVFRAEPDKLGLIKARRAIVAEGRDRHVQTLLKDLGLLSAAGVDGKFGSGSANVVRNFQLSRGLQGTGEVDTATYVQLCDAVRQRNGERRGDGLTPLPERERNGAGNAYAGGGVVAGVGAGGAVVGGAILEGEEQPQTDQTPADGQQQTQTTDQAPQQAPTTDQTTTPTPPDQPAHPAPAPTTHTETQQPEPAPTWRETAGDWLPWAAIALVLVAVLMFSLARRRGY